MAIEDKAVVESGGIPGVSGYSHEMEYFDASPLIQTMEWTPAPPGTPNAKSTQVHMMFAIGGNRIGVVRFKGAAGLDRFIADLQAHRESVWGK